MQDKINRADNQGPLFRSEAIEWSSNKLGPPVDAYGIRGWYITIFLFSLLVTIVAFVSLTNYSRKESVVGSLVPSAGMNTLISMRQGYVNAMYVEEGQNVNVSDPIISIASGDSVSTGEDISRLRIMASEDELGQIIRQNEAVLSGLRAQITEIEARSDQLRSELEYYNRDYEIIETRVRIASDAFDAAQSLYDRQLMAAPQLRQRQEVLLAAQQARSNHDRERISIEHQLQQLGAQRSRIMSQIAESEAVASQRVNQNRNEQLDIRIQEGQLIRATRAGRVSSILVRPGSVVSPGQPLGVISSPDAKLEAEVWLPSRAVGFVGIGSRVRILYDAFPYHRYGSFPGVIKSISHNASEVTSLPAHIGASEPMYRAIVSIDRQYVDVSGSRRPITPGMMLRADIVLDSKPIIMWVLEPIISAYNRL